MKKLSLILWIASKNNKKMMTASAPVVLVKVMRAEYTYQMQVKSW